MSGFREALAAVAPSPEEVRAARYGDELIAAPDVVMDRAFTLPAPVERCWPWFVQLGKQRSGWYLPRSVERLIPRSRRAIRAIDPALQDLAVGDVIPDWGGRDETFEVAQMNPPKTLIHRSKRGRTNVSWAINLEPDSQDERVTRVTMRLRLGPVRRKRLAESIGDGFDLLTIAGLAAGLTERLNESR